MNETSPWHVGYRGNANTWECDENGHLNVRHYVGKADQALASFLAAIGLPPPELDRLALCARPADQHMRFHAEVPAGGGLLGRVGVTRIDAGRPEVLVELVGPGGRLQATLLTRLQLLRAPTLTAADFSAAQLEAMRDCLLSEVPTTARPRSISRAAVYRDWRLTDIEALPFVEISRGRIESGECGRDGLLQQAQFVGRVSDGIVNLRTALQGETLPAERLGGAVLEYFVEVRRLPRAGDLVTVRSGLAGLGAKTFDYVHLMFDAVTGELAMAARATAVSFDLVTRRAVAIPDATRRGLEGRCLDDPRFWPAVEGSVQAGTNS